MAFVEQPPIAASRSTAKWLLIIIAVSLALRIGAAVPSHASGFVSDEREYLFLAQNLLQGQGFVDSNGEHSIRAPLFPALLALLIFAGAGSLLPAFLAVALIAAASAYVVFRIAAELADSPRCGLAAASAFALHPGLVLYGSLLMSESLFILLMLLCLLLAARLLNTGAAVHGVLLGLLAGAATLTRAVFFGFFPVLLGVVAYRLARARGSARAVALSLLVWCLVLTPWAVRNYSIHHTLVPVSTYAGRSLLVGNNPFSRGTTKLSPGFEKWLEEQMRLIGEPDSRALSETDLSAAEQTIAARYMMSHPLQTLALMLRKAFVFWIYPLSHHADDEVLQAFLMTGDVILLLVALIGLAFLQGKGKSLVLLWTPVLFFTALHMILHAEARYRLPLIPLLCVFAGGVAFAMDMRARSVWSDPRVRRTIRDGAIGIVGLYALAGLLRIIGFCS